MVRGPTRPTSSHLALLFMILFLTRHIAAIPTKKSIHTTNIILDYQCTTSNNWTKPYWPATVYMPCEKILYFLERSQSEVHGLSIEHEFLPEDALADPTVPNPVRTPWKLTLGM